MSTNTIRTWSGLLVVALAIVGCGNTGGSTPPAPEPAGAPLPASTEGLPDLIGATALSNHYVQVTFSAAPGDQAAEPGAYSITEADGTVLTVAAAWIDEDPAKVILTTGPQQEVEYQLRVVDSGDGGRSKLASRASQGGIVTFTGSTDGEPCLASAISLGQTSVLLTFTEPMDATVETGEYYRISSPDLDITAAVQSDEETMAVLTTETQENIEYTVKVTNVTSEKDSTLIDPTRCTATFYGIPPDDDINPTLDGAVCTSASTVLLSFSEPLDDQAPDSMNFILTSSDAGTHGAPDPVLIGAELTTYATQVLLTTLPLTAEVQYTVTVTNANGKMCDLQDNAIDPDHCTASFTFVGQPGIEDASTLPRVVSAHSLDNFTVIVIFSKAMGDGAIDPENYMIVQTNLLPEAAALVLLEAEFLGLDRTAVRLTTLSQSTVQYDLFAVGVKDQAGNQLGPKILHMGVLIDPTHATFWGNGPAGNPPDTDGDGLPDNIEQGGWNVTIVLADGSTSSQQVTSDPYLVDTEADGLDDYIEWIRRSEPRNPDTDADGVPDADEHYVWFTSPIHQDTDGDGLTETREINLFKTSPILADTDGDGFDDHREIFEMNRNPRLADLPQPELTVGDMRLQIDERYTYVDQEGRTVSEESSSTSTLSQSRSTKFSSSDTRTTENLIEASAKVGHKTELEASESFEVGGKIGLSSKQTTTLSGEAAFKSSNKWGSTSQVSQESANSSQQAYENSLSKGLTYTTTSTVTRQVFGASVDAGLTLGNAGDIAFTLSNVEVSVLQPGRTLGEFVPAATLLPGSELLGGDAAVFNLLPLEKRGPIIFSNREVFPNLVEDLMRAPRGLIFRAAYFDVTDEFGRNLAYITQDVLERTAILTVDPGDGTFKRYFVATCGGLDTEEYAGGGLVGGFDDHGVARGIPMDFVLQDILGLVKDPETPNAIIAGYNGVADTVAEAGDVQAVPPATTGLPDRTAVVLAGQDGVLDTEPNNVNPLGDDVVAFTTGYETSPTCGAQTEPRIIEPEFDNPELGGDAVASTEAQGDDVQEVPVGDAVAPGQVIVSAGPNGLLETVARGDDVYAGPGDLCDPDDADACPGGSCTGNEAIVRFENSATGDPNRFWVVFSSAQIPIGTDFGDYLLKPDEAITLAFGQDVDRDGLFAREEFIHGSSDRMKDTDEDTLGDFAETRVGWPVKVPGRADAQVFPAPTLPDSDFDDLGDEVEKQCRTDPRTRDTDGDGLTDSEEIDFGRCCSNGIGSDCATPALPCNDTLPCNWCNGGDNDGQRCRLGDDDDCPGGICEPDPDYPFCFNDLGEVCTDEDDYDPQDPHARLDPRNPDTDGDSLSDSLEFSVGSNPLDPSDADAFRDTDLDGLTDQEEQAGWEVTIHWCDLPDCAPSDSTEWYYPDPLEGDSDFDGLPDYLERELATNPTDDDTDCDGILDYDEFAEFGAYMNLAEIYPGFYLSGSGSQQLGTDPTSQDTDGDRLPDNFELYNGWRVLACTDDSPREVYPDPLYFDTDLDGLSDLQEYSWCRPPIFVESPDFLQNGEFDDSADPWESWAPLGGWQSDPGWDGAPGRFWLEADWYQTPWIRQVVNGLTPGKTYVVAGYYKSLHQHVGGPSFNVLLEGAVCFEGGSEEVAEWTRFECIFVAADVHAELELVGQVDFDSDYLIDHVRVESVGLVRNGEFADPVNPDDEDDPWQQEDVWATAGWQSDPGWDGAPGRFWLEAGPGQVPSISQVVTRLTPGETYVVAGHYKSYYQHVGGPSFNVLVDDIVHFKGGEAFVDEWTRFWFTWTPTSTAATLQLRGQVGSDSDYYIDGVQMALLEYPLCQPTDPTDPDTDNDGHLDKGETFPLGCGKVVTVRCERYYVGDCTCGGPEGDVCDVPDQFFFHFSVEHNGQPVGATLGASWWVDNWLYYSFPPTWSKTIAMRPDDYIDVIPTSSNSWGVSCEFFSMRKAYDELTDEIVSQGPTGCHWCFGTHRFGLSFLVEP